MFKSLHSKGNPSLNHLSKILNGMSPKLRSKKPTLNDYDTHLSELWIIVVIHPSFNISIRRS